MQHRRASDFSITRIAQIAAENLRPKMSPLAARVTNILVGNLVQEFSRVSIVSNFQSIRAAEHPGQTPSMHLREIERRCRRDSRPKP